MRIISGLYKGRRIDLPKSMQIRPTTDMAKESLFNVLRNYVNFEDIEALDLFSGTGSISYEIVSRGAKSVIAVEQNGQHVRFIETSIKKLEMENLRVIRMDVFQFIKASKKSFDLIFADPPYDLSTIEELPEIILSKEMLAPEGILVLEHSKKNSFNAHPSFFDHRNYGSVNFSFFRKQV